MTDNSEILGTHKGLPIKETQIVVNKLGDGLSAAVAVEPIVISAGEVAYLAVRVLKTKDNYVYEYDDEGEPVSVTLVQVFNSTGAMFTDEALAKAGIQRMVDRIAEAEALRRGQLTLNIVDGGGNNSVPGVESLPNARRRRNAPRESAIKVDEAFGGDG